MFADKAAGDNFFARIRALDIECPQCGETFYCTGKTGPYQMRTATFTCPRCTLRLGIGVYAYPRTSARYKQAPPDQKPNYRQSQAIRNQMSGFLQPEEKRRGWAEPHNVVIREGCKCSPGGSGRALIIHPGCPIHA